MEKKKEISVTFGDMPVSLSVLSQGNYEHRHLAIELLFVLSGETQLLTEGNLYRLHTEDVCVINRNMLHKVMVESGNILSIRFRPELLEYMHHEERLYFILNSAKDTDSHRYDHIRAMVAHLFKAMISGKNKYFVLGLVYEIIAHLVEYFRGVPPENVTRMSESGERMGEITNYIEKNYRTGVSLKELAQKYSLSVPYLSALFEKKVGMTFSAYYNWVRLSHAVNDMLSSDSSLEKIALRNGFSDSRSFTSVFKKRYDCLPSEYRKSKRPVESENSIAAWAEEKETVKETEAVRQWESLEKYLYLEHKKNTSLPGSTIYHDGLLIDGGTVDYLSEGIHLSHKFHTLCCVGSARQLLYADVQEMLQQLQKDIGYRYVKFHGILSDEMMVYTEDSQGRERYSFTMIDKAMDFLMSISLRPLIQLSFMPVALASDPNRMVDMGNFNTSPPKNMRKWIRLVQALIKHLIQRYSYEEVSQWLFCVWNEPDSQAAFGWKDTELFYRFYKATYQAVKNISSEFCFGTPSLLLAARETRSWIDDFFKFCRENQCMPDFLNIHYYDNSFPNDDPERIFDLEKLSNAQVPLNEDPFAFTRFVNELKYRIRQLKIEHLPIYLTEWNLTISHRDLLNDTCFKACYLVKNLLDNYDRMESFGYWCLTDFIEELQIPGQLFHGGLGMFTFNKIPKAHYNAFCLMSHLGDWMIGRGNGYFITKTYSGLSMILYNYEHFSRLFARGEFFRMTNENRYTPFTRMDSVFFQVVIKNLPGKKCLIKEQFINQEHGSSFDLWVKMGASQVIPSDMEEVLRSGARPGMFVHQEHIADGTLKFEAVLEPLEVRLVEIECVE